MKLTKWGKEHYRGERDDRTLCGLEIPPGVTDDGRDGPECVQCVKKYTAMGHVRYKRDGTPQRQRPTR